MPLLSFFSVISASNIALLGNNNIPIFFSGALLMAMICSLFCVKDTLLRLSFLASGMLGLAIISTDLPWLNIILAFGFCFNLWQSFERNNTVMFAVSTIAALLFVCVFTGYLLFDLRLYWVVSAVLLLAVAVLIPQPLAQPLSDNTSESAELVAANNFLPSSPLAALPSRKSIFNTDFNRKEKSEFTGVIVVLRLEGFEQVNQHIGRDFGDLLLAQSASRIQNALEHDEVIALENDHKLAHLGGLNFAFMCSLARQKHVHEQLIQTIIKATLKPFNVDNCTVEIKIRASYVSCSSAKTFDESLLSAAFLALDSHPEQQVVPYNRQMTIAQREQQARIKELASIDFSSELELYFQPVICNSNGQIEFLELLLRWQHPKQGILSAQRFIDDIKIAGLGYPLAKFVMTRAAELAMALKLENIATPLSINVFGPEMLHEEFVEYITALVEEHKLTEGELIIECPLDVFTKLDDKGLAMVARLNNLGLKICVDGLGDNPVLLSKLPSLTVDYIKVSPSLTADFSNRNNIRSLVGGMVDMHSQQRSKVIFEGVETIEQLNFVKSLNAYAAQGFYFGHPLSSVGLLSWIKQWRIERSHKIS